MKQFILLLIVIVVVLIAFRSNKCDHIYVAIEESDIKISEPQWYGVDNLIPPSCSWPSGKHEGKEIICVKCLDKRKQILDYGEIKYGGVSFYQWPTPLAYTDTCITFRSTGHLFMKVDSILPLSFKRK